MQACYSSARLDDLSHVLHQPPIRFVPAPFGDVRLKDAALAEVLGRKRGCSARDMNTTSNEPREKTWNHGNKAGWLSWSRPCQQNRPSTNTGRNDNMSQLSLYCRRRPRGFLGIFGGEISTLNFDALAASLAGVRLTDSIEIPHCDGWR